ncbi:MAG TPA: hypothetical protein VI299_09220 [Polyangiales bacterium]
MRCAILALSCTSCALGPDIVAVLAEFRGDDAGGPVITVEAGGPVIRLDGGRPVMGSDAGAFSQAKDARIALDSGFGPFCAGIDLNLLLADEQGDILRVKGGDVAATNVGRADCLANGVEGLAIDGRGTIWASAADGSTWTIDSSWLCKPSPIDARVQSWAFVYRPALGSEWLYALEDGLLVAYDVTHGFEARTLTSLSARWLVGTSSGLLYAVGSDGQELAVSIVDLDTGSVTPQAKFMNPEATQPGGAAMWDARLVLMFGRTLYAFDLIQLQATSLLTVPNDGLAVTGLAASWCASAK